MVLEYPDDLKYLDSHEYVHLDGDIATIGVSAYAIEQLGDVVFLELPEIGDSVTVDETFGTIESTKAVDKLHSPVSGEVIDRNEDMIESPESIADDPYDDGWLIKVKLTNPNDDLSENLLSSSEYAQKVEGEED